MRSNPLIKATFLANSPCIVSRLNLSTTATCFLSKVAVVDRLNCTLCATEYIHLLGVFQERKVQQVVRVFLSHLNRYCGPWQDMKLDHLSTVYTNLQHSGNRRSFHLFLTCQNVSRITARTWWMSYWRLTSDPMHELWVNILLLTFQCSHDWNLTCS